MRDELKAQGPNQKHGYECCLRAFILATCFYAGGPLNDAVAQERQFNFGLIGNLSYFPERWIERVFDDVNRDDSLAFVVHVGGLSQSKLACTGQMRRRRFSQFRNSPHPVVYTPGQTDWADCFRTKGHAADRPLSTLSKLRTTFFSEQIVDWRTKIDMVSQGSDNALFANYRENARWQFSNVTFLTLHVIGGNNNLGRSPEADEEFTTRTNANLAWLHAGFEYAALRRSDAIVLFMQADIFRFPLQSFTRRRPSGYFRLRSAVEREARLFAKPVVIAHSEFDDNPWKDNDNRTPPHDSKGILRVGAFATPRQHWIKISISNQPLAFEVARKQPINR